MTAEMEKKGEVYPGMLEAPLESTVENGEVSSVEDNDLLGKTVFD